MGDVAAGKTSLIRLLSTGQPVTKTPGPTVGCDLEVMLYTYCPEPPKELATQSLLSFESRYIEKSRREPKDYFIEFLEIGATHTHVISRRMFYHDYNGVILLYDLSSARSCHRLQFWRQELASYTYERTDGGFETMYGRAPEGVTVGDERKLLPTRKIPVLIVGTKTDLPSHVRSEHRVWVDKAIDDYRASEIRLSCLDATDLTPESAKLKTLHAFFDKVIEAKFPNAASVGSALPSSPEMRTRSSSRFKIPAFMS
ncbi:hypothetical protein RvY_13120 [Ramazzottius varieornatus]|uniref:P-loop containing nucleoside triphosphate hydrolase protein n=1 Tax=Ramazzottius varieornatus TaxID=947166 RepID=A0A1D1VP18_RAMVA|nr:hypothetical protein RvY_13120 [Ramazzottius varieornatus]